MRRRQWSSEEKFKIVLEGLKNPADIKGFCEKYRISQTQYYKWRDQFLKFGHKAFECKKITLEEKRLRTDNKRLKQILEEMIDELRRIDLDLK